MESNQDREFEKILEDYNKSTLKFNQNPHGKVMDDDEGYNGDAHKYGEAARVEMDMLLAKIVERKSSEINFLSVEKGKDGITRFIYIPFGDYLKDMDASYTLIKAGQSNKGSLIYIKNSNKKIEWYIKVLNGPIQDIFTFKLGKWFGGELNYQLKMKEFCRDAANAIRYNPHEECGTYAIYVEHFLKWMEQVEDNAMIICNIVSQVTDNLKTVLYLKERKVYEAQGILQKMTLLASTRMLIKDCSKACHDQFAKIDFKSEKSVDYIEEFRRRALEASQAKQAKLPKLSKPAPASMKRPRPESEDEESGRPAKKMKLDKDNDNDKDHDNKNVIEKTEDPELTYP